MNDSLAVVIFFVSLEFSLERINYYFIFYGILLCMYILVKCKILHLIFVIQGERTAWNDTCAEADKFFVIFQLSKMTRELT